jgi:polyhydroxyalkanoate synthase
MLHQLYHFGFRNLQQHFKNFTGYCHDLRDFNSSVMKYLSWLNQNPAHILQLNKTYFNFLEELQKTYLRSLTGDDSQEEDNTQETKTKKDKRFSGEQWNKYPFFTFLYKSHLLKEKYLNDIVETSQLPNKIKNKFYFYSKFLLDATAPSNYFFTNPEAIKIAIETGGNSILKGWNNLIHDISNLDITQTDESAFKVGENIAFTKGKVIFRNNLIELIHYSPTKNKINKIPLLIIPPWINKYYILDLQSHNSFVKFLTEQGIDTYIISWKNPDHDLSKITFDDYVEKGCIKALEQVSLFTNEKNVNTLGYCLGGTLLSVTAAILVKRKYDFRINSISLLAAMVDFTDIGPMRHVIDKALVKKIERGELLINQGIMHGKYMEAGFNLIRANDLIWYYVVNNYLEGKKPKPFDVLFWTNDNTNLPAGMFIFYMNKMIIENKLSEKNALSICNEKIDISLIAVPVCAVGFCEDHISPAKTVFETMNLLRGEKKFILGMSGHVMGVVNPPGKTKYGYYINQINEGNFEKWKDTSTKVNDSWWNEWLKFIKSYSGEEVDSQTNFSEIKNNTLGDAPGIYVHEKCGSLV